jgi:hypothetical protein
LFVGVGAIKTVGAAWILVASKVLSVPLNVLYAFVVPTLHATDVADQK